ncbi:sterol desaturase family protein [Pedobacter boryungensis]|uniref:Sterol desaturase family protein n=1 Tax=Pedobacter boryungensis TaxID=869962 RepID=A0ABX2DDS4_9SPHI|nr:sterol desaturase family protein [Pedobacter boryungensis]NQX31972.1 sterol desaturase family protein [Pedobacter boryungensis]
MTPENFLKYIFDVGTRYFLIAGIAFLIFYVLFHERFSGRRLQKKMPKMSDHKRDVFYSIITIVIFGALPVIFLENDKIRPYTQLYQHISDHGWVYFILAFPLMLLIHDAYFYWTHRIMHHPKLFKLFHLIHHKSTSPTPWTAYSFHPLEAVVETGIFVVIIFIMPVHQIHLAVFFTIVFVYNVYGHLGYELFSPKFHKSWIGRWISTGTAHNMHHQFFKGNYGLYFLFWDRWMGTLRPEFDQKFLNTPSKKEQIITEKSMEEKVIENDALKNSTGNADEK